MQRQAVGLADDAVVEYMIDCYYDGTSLACRE
jgi:hypothetical protein